MTTEIVASELQFQADITPATIEIFNYDVLEKGIAQVVKKYDGLILTAADIKDAKEIKTKLNKLNKAMSDRRIEIKKAVNAPVVEFEAKIKALTSQVDSVLTPINESIKLAEEGERLQRESEINKMITELVEPLNYSLADIEINQKWYNKTAKKDDIKKEVLWQVSELDKLATQLKENTIALNSYATSKNIEAYSYIAQLEAGAQLSDLFTRIDKEAEHIENKRLAAERQAQADEQRRIKAEQEALNIVNEALNDDNLPFTVSDDIKPQTQPATDVPTTEQLTTDVIEVTATYEQLVLLNEFFKANNIIVKGHSCD